MASPSSTDAAPPLRAPGTPEAPEAPVPEASVPEAPVVVRFAPSPTGRLHLGNARVAVINALFALAQGGRFILRLDDTDTARGTVAFAQAIRDDLRWLGIVWEREESQLARAARHAEALDHLRHTGRLYPCYETPDELESRRRRQRQRGLPPVYDRAALALTDAQRAALEASGRRPHWRFRLDHEDIAWTDLVRGPCHYHGAHLSDPILVREDGGLLYTLPSVVDDLDFGVTHVLRGEDHVVNTAVQIQLARALGGTPPHWGHFPLVLNAEGGPLSKREGALSIGDLREQGCQPEAINALLAALGTGEAPDPTQDLAGLARGFRLEAFGRSAPRLDPQDLTRLNARVLHGLPYDEARRRGVTAPEAVWEAVRGNLTRLSEVSDWLRVIEGPVLPGGTETERPFLDQALALLPPPPWDTTTWTTWTKALKEASGRTGKSLYRPLRQALTGLDHGPDMTHLLPLIGPDRTRARLVGLTA